MQGTRRRRRRRGFSLIEILVAVAILSGAANLGASPAAGKIGVTTLAFFLGTSALAVLLALFGR